MGISTNQERRKRTPLRVSAVGQTGRFASLGRRRWIGNKQGRRQMGATSRGRRWVDEARTACREQFRVCGAPLRLDLRA